MKKLQLVTLISFLLFSLHFPMGTTAGTQTISDLTPGDLVTYSDKEWVYLQSMASQPQGLFLRTNSEISRYYYNSGSPIDVHTNFDPNDDLTVAYWLNFTYIEELEHTDWIQTRTWGGASAKIGLPSRDEAELNEAVILARLNSVHDYYTLTAATDYDINIMNVRSRNDRDFISPADASVGNIPAVVAPAIYLHPDLYVDDEGEVLACLPPDFITSPADAAGNWQQDDVSVTLTNGSCYNGEGEAEYRIQTPDGNGGAWEDYTDAITFDQEGRYVLEGRMSVAGSAVGKAEILIDRTPPLISLEADPTERTTGEVTITAEVTDNGEVSQKKWDAGDQDEVWFEDADNGTELAEGSFTVSRNGTYTVFARDAAGNTAVESIDIRNISSPSPPSPPIDREAPVLTLLGGESMAVTRGAVFKDPGATAVDNVDGDLSNAIEATGDVNTDTPGVYMITYEVRDAAGNTATAERQVRVVDILGVQLDDASGAGVIGYMHNLVAQPLYEEDVLPDVTHHFSYASSDTALATVDEDGQITFHDSGEVMITVRYGPVEETLTFQVTHPDLAVGEVQAVQSGMTYHLAVETNGEAAEVSIRMPDTLPEGTRLSVDEYIVDEETLAAASTTEETARLIQVGPALTFHFVYEGEEYDGSEPFVLMMPYGTSGEINEDAERVSDSVAVYYLNEAAAQPVWERRGGDVDTEQQTVTLEVAHFSTYGVFAEESEDAREEGTDGDEPDIDGSDIDGSDTDGSDADGPGTDGLNTGGSGTGGSDNPGPRTGGSQTDGGQGSEERTPTGTSNTAGEGERLPHTASMHYHFLLVGLLLFVIGGVIVLYQYTVHRKQKV